MRYKNRYLAGNFLAQKLGSYTDDRDAVVLALPRGGVPVGFAAATRLNVPLDVFIVRKLGTPNYPELAMGAIANGGVRVLNRDVIAALRIPQNEIERVFQEELTELKRREIAYKGSTELPDVKGKHVILVDDGLATGATMKAAVRAARILEPKRVICAVPVASELARHEFADEADEFICPFTPEPFGGVGQWYQDFSQISDEEVVRLLTLAKKRYSDAA